MKPGALHLPSRGGASVLAGFAGRARRCSDTRSNITPDANSVLIVTQKVVSKAEGRRVRLADVDVTAEAQALADLTGKDPVLSPHFE